MVIERTLKFITGNVHKFYEINSFLKENLPHIRVEQRDLPLVEIQAEKLEDVAIFKVKSALVNIDPPYFIEDAGFFVDDVLKGFPGVYSSYVMKTIGYSGILKLMEGKENRRAHFESVIAYMDENEGIHLFKGQVMGKIALQAAGTSGFGFDPIFIPDEMPQKTFAQMSTEEKNEISHRRRALSKFLEYLEKN